MKNIHRIFYMGIGVFGTGLAGHFFWKNDPEGIAKRNPASIHARQQEWPASCRDKLARKQSPISISTELFNSKKTTPIQTNFGMARIQLVDVGHTFQVRMLDGDSSLTFEGSKYQLKQFHFHKPSEHIIDGKQHEMEVHFVFAESSKKMRPPKTMVLGYLIRGGSENAEISRIWKYLPPYREGYGEAGFEQMPVIASQTDTVDNSHREDILTSDVTIDLQRLIPKSTSFYIYDGSLTTPPCDEGVTHAVALALMEFDHNQIEHFEGYYEGSNRDIQPLGSLNSRNFRRGILD